jgi:putative membrane protein
MTTTNSLEFVWGWFFWVGLIFLFFSTTGNWRYTYQAHRRFRELSGSKDAMDLLSERFAKGDIARDEFFKMKDEILLARKSFDTQKLRALAT